jgi:hypothetical protein
MIDKNGWVNVHGTNYFVDEYGKATGKTFTGIVGNEYYMALLCEKDYLTAYNQCPPLKAIISKRSKAFNAGRTIIRNIETKQPSRGQSDIKKLLRRPNVLQNESQFFAQQNHYIDLFGYCPVLTIQPSGYQGTDVFSSLWNIPPWLFDITYTNKWLKQNKLEGIYDKYFIFWNGDQYELDFKSLKFIFDDGIGTENDTNLTIPDSRLVGMDYIISNIMAGYKSRNTLITKRGAIGILSNEAKDESGNVAMLPALKNDLQTDFARYGLTGQPYQIIITDATLKWQQMGVPTKDLLLFEEETANIERLCDAYGWPVELIARGKDVTYDNKLQARKDLFQNTIIPESDSRMQQFSRIFYPEDSNVEIAKDYSEVPVLQDDRKTKAETRTAINVYCQIEYNAGLMSKNDWLEELGLERKEDPEWDEYKEPEPVEDEFKKKGDEK